MMHLPLFDESNAMGIEFDNEEEKQKIKLLVVAMNASKTLGKSAYAIWTCYFD